MQLRSLLFAALLTLPGAAYAQYETPADVYEDVLPILSKAPSINEIEICVEGVCETFGVVHWQRKGGSADLLYQAPKGGVAEGNGAAEAVGDIVGAVGSKVGAGGRIVVDYEHTKSPDGTEKTKVKVELSVGVGSAAAGAAGPGTPAAN